MRLTTEQEATYRAGALVIGPETDMQERLERAKRGLPDLPPIDVWQYTEKPVVGKNVVRDRQGNLCWPPCHDPRHEPRTVKECGQEYEDTPFVRISMIPAPPEPQEERYDDHVRRHRRLLSRGQELRDLIELCWVYKTGKLKTAGKLQGATDGEPGADRAEIAAEYLESTPTFGELLWPVVVAVGEGRFTRAQWHNRRPSFTVARALWVPFMVRLVERLAKESFETYYQRRARELYVIPQL